MADTKDDEDTGVKFDRSLTHLYIQAVIVLSALTLGSILAISWIRVGEDNTSIIATIIGITSPASLAFIGLSVKEVYLSTNHRLTELVELTAKSSFAAGKLDINQEKK